MLELMYITNNADVARIADETGVDRIWIDLETLGKEERQADFDSVKSKHSLNDISRIKPILNHSKLQVRVNPINPNSKLEIQEAIANGADYIMLPYYKTTDEVKKFVEYVDGRTITILLLETKEAADIIDETLAVQGIDEIHIGLNDLHISYGKTFMFELLTDGTVQRLTQKIKKAGLPYGFGGIARLGYGMLPAEKIIGEHYHLKSSRAILSRSFCNYEKCRDLEEVKYIFQTELKRIRDYEAVLANWDEAAFLKNYSEIDDAVKSIVYTIQTKNNKGE